MQGEYELSLILHLLMAVVDSTSRQPPKNNLDFLRFLLELDGRYEYEYDCVTVVICWLNETCNLFYPGDSLQSLPFVRTNSSLARPRDTHRNDRPRRERGAALLDVIKETRVEKARMYVCYCWFLLILVTSIAQCSISPILFVAILGSLNILEICSLGRDHITGSIKNHEIQKTYHLLCRVMEDKPQKSFPF